MSERVGITNAMYKHKRSSACFGRQTLSYQVARRGKQEHLLLGYLVSWADRTLVSMQRKTGSQESSEKTGACHSQVWMCCVKISNDCKAIYKDYLFDGLEGNELGSGA